jgi:hypothetical protein
MTLEGAAATPLAALLFGSLSLENYGIPAGRPVVAIASGRNIDTILLSQMGDKHGGGRWRRMKDEFEDLRSKLAAGGWLVKGSVRPLATPEEGIAFVDVLTENLPDGWDLIDAFERLDFGRWRDKKDINGTLRSFGQYHQRWNHSKEESLTHPMTNRGQELKLSLERLDAGMTTIYEILKDSGWRTSIAFR